MLDDLLIVKRIKDGEIHAYERVFRTYYLPLTLYARSISGDMDVAEEIVQQLFYVLWRDRETLQVLTSLKGYLYTATRNKALQYCEHNAVRSRHKSEVLSGEVMFATSPQEQLEYKELDGLIRKVMDAMPERRRLIFQLHRSHGIRYAAIATELCVSVKTVEAEMSKALKALRSIIEKYTQ